MKKEYKFITEYTFNGKRYGSSILASSIQEAEEKLKEKTYTETIVGYDPTVEYVNELDD